MIQQELAPLRRGRGQGRRPARIPPARAWPGSAQAGTAVGASGSTRAAKSSERAAWSTGPTWSHPRTHRRLENFVDVARQDVKPALCVLVDAEIAGTDPVAVAVDE